MRFLTSLLLLGAAACSSSATNAAGANDNDLTNGTKATSADANAVGAIVEGVGSAAKTLCTATLVDASTIATSSKCPLLDDSGVGKRGLSFVFGANVIDASARRIDIDVVSPCPGSTCGFTAAHLAQPVTDVAPIAFAPLGQTAARDRTFATVGFDTNRDRVVGIVTVHAVYGGGLVVVGGTDREARLCQMDIGAPLLGEIDRKPALFGVASIATSTDAEGCADTTPFNMLNGAARAIFQPTGPDPVEATPPAECSGETVEGRCDGDVAVRCTSAAEGVRRVTRVDCAESLQKCLPPGASNQSVSCGDSL